MKKLINRLRSNHSLTPNEYSQLVDCTDQDTIDYLHSQARDVALAQFGNRIYIRGLIEVSNYCQNDCYYCGIRNSNRAVKRYRLDRETILACCKEGYDAGFRTFVLQGGEKAGISDNALIETIGDIRRLYPDCAITLSLGERSDEAYKHFYKAGANRYLLRHETINPLHYKRLHPETMSLESRLRCLASLKSIGYQVGTGIMVGTPFQTTSNIVEDILFVESLRPEMIGIGPFIPHRDTPFANCPAGSTQLTLVLISIFRLINPSVLMPSTTALSTSDPKGMEKGILAGANVIMPNLTPNDERRKYELYDNKAAQGIETIEMLRQQMRAIGYELSAKRGDYGSVQS